MIKQSKAEKIGVYLHSQLPFTGIGLVIFVTRPAITNHVSAEKLPIFSVFAVS